MRNEKQRTSKRIDINTSPHRHDGPASGITRRWQRRSAAGGEEREILRRAAAPLDGPGPRPQPLAVALQIAVPWDQANVAHRWGFWHMGQFARDYRRLFGELPSETRDTAG